MRRRWFLLVILVLAGLATWVVAQNDFRPSVFGRELFRREGFRLGLDLKGGTHLVYEADLSQLGPGEDPAEAVQGAIDTIKRRVDAFGVTEPIIQKQGERRISVQLPGVRNIDEAIRLMGQTAQLEFKEAVVQDGRAVLDALGNPQWEPATALGSAGVQAPLKGSFLKRTSQVVFASTTNEPEVAFEFDAEGARLFKQITQRLTSRPASGTDQWERRLAIFLDTEMISAPIVQAVIEDRGVITGLTLERARTLAIQLNSGALPVPLGDPVEREDIDPILGADSLRRSLLAGEIGLALVLLFMIVYYRVPGVLASLALVIYTLVLLAIFKLMPVTLTLGGIAAFIISVGMAVDANILIFERMKEELTAGRTLGAALESGFGRAWPSIRDSNISTFITCAILYWFGNSFGETQIMGFALTLFIGVAVSMFSAITVTRTFLRVAVKTSLGRKLSLFLVLGHKAPQEA